MTKERYNQIIDEAYKNYEKEYERGSHLEGTGLLWMAKESKETFIYRIKTDKEFSERWGLEIEERELSLEEQIDLALEWGHDSFDLDMAMCNSEDGLTEYGIPAKLITVTYNNKTIEIYE
jgi:hypothetical protein